MSERDTEIEFDFFEEPDEAPEESRSRSPLRRAPRGPGRPPPGGSRVTPLIRLVVVVVVAIALVVLLVFVVDRCRGNGREAAYEDYMNDVAKVATDSEQAGRTFVSILINPTAKVADVEDQLRGLATRQDQGVDRARDIDPPGALREQHRHVIEALQLRASGLRGLADAFQRTTGVAPKDAAELLADQARRLTASDVVWDDLFKDPAALELGRRNVRGVPVPDSNFLADPNLASVGQLRPIFRRIRTSTVGIPKDTVRGNRIVALTALPQDEELSTEELTVVQASTRLSFRVAVENSGDVPEVRIPVTLTIRKPRRSIVKTTEIATLNPGQTKTVTFTNFVDPPIGPQTTILVEVKPVDNEANDENNVAEYLVTFTL
ncbi:MAG: CARDB domain-containing protein [Gaiellaceae bacterium]